MLKPIPSSIALIKELNKLVGQANPESALKGLEEVTKAFRILIICYAGPNPVNTEGMADDPQDFLHHFAQILESSIRKDVEEYETSSDQVPGV